MASEEAALVVAAIRGPAKRRRPSIRTTPRTTESAANSDTASLLRSAAVSPSPPANPASLLMLATWRKAKTRPRLSKTVEAGPSAASSRVVAHRPTTAVSTAERTGEARLDPRAGRAKRRIAPTSDTQLEGPGAPLVVAPSPPSLSPRLDARPASRRRRTAASKAAVAVKGAQIRPTPLIDPELLLGVDGESLVCLLPLIPRQEGVEVHVVPVLRVRRRDEGLALPVVAILPLFLLFRPFFRPTPVPDSPRWLAVLAELPLLGLRLRNRRPILLLLLFLPLLLLLGRRENVVDDAGLPLPSHPSALDPAPALAPAPLAPELVPLVLKHDQPRRTAHRIFLCECV
mmetsp:Transcript_4795/g.16791  ORF Transcript_4795/g.16791 Transcript_4795/m.16791 type:complete len:344 (+) Transcript_4795:1030-2061(+)